MALAETQYGKFYYYEPDAIGRKIASGDFWDAHFKPYFDQLTDKSMVVDVGANIGFFTVYAAKRGAHVLSFEASPEVFSLLHRNVELNNIDLNVRLENIALYDKDTILTLNPEWNDWPKLSDGRIDYEHHNNSGGMSLVEDGVGPYKIIARTLDSYKVINCDLIKVDTQGADLNVLLGACDTIKKFRPIICFEVEPYTEDKFNKFKTFFSPLNYAITVVGSGSYNIDCVGVPNG